MFFIKKYRRKKTVWSCGGVFNTLILLYTEFFEKITKRTRKNILKIEVSSMMSEIGMRI